MVKRVAKFAQAHRIANFEKNLKRMKKAADARKVHFEYNIAPLITQTMGWQEYLEAWGREGYKWESANQIPSDSPERRKQMDMLNAEKNSWRLYKRPNLYLKRDELPAELIDMVDDDNFYAHADINDHPEYSSFGGLKLGQVLNLEEVRNDGASPTYDLTYIIRQRPIYKRRGHIVNLEYGDFADSSWEVLAVLEPLLQMYFDRGEQPYIINKMPHLGEGGEEEELNIHELLPSEVVSMCEHCNTVRQRKKLIVVKDKETGEVRTVGTNCLFEYTNIEPELIMKLYQTLETPLYGDPTIRRSLEQYDLFDFIGKAHRLFGYNNVYEKRMGWSLFYGVFYNPILASADPSTEGLVLDESISFLVPYDYGSMNTNPFSKFSLDTLRQKGRPALPMSDEVIDVASEIISYCANLEGRSDFERNLKTIAQNGVVTKKNSGLAASMWFVWNRAREEGKLESVFGFQPIEEVGVEDIPVSEHLGEMGERIEFTGVLMRKSSRESQWGMTHLLVFTTVEGGNYPAGSEVVWWASTNKRLPNVGDLVRVRGTVKRHGEFKGVPNTTIGRGHLTILEE
jgi:hypothetical protein